MEDEHSVLVPASDLLRVPARWLSSIVTSKETDPWNLWISKNWRHGMVDMKNLYNLVWVQDPVFLPRSWCNCPGLSHDISSLHPFMVDLFDPDLSGAAAENGSFNVFCTQLFSKFQGSRGWKLCVLFAEPGLDFVAFLQSLAGLK